MEKILTVDDVADILQVKPITVREMFREKRLRAFKVGKAWRTTETMLTQDLAAMAGAEGLASVEILAASFEEEPQETAPSRSKDRSKGRRKSDKGEPKKPMFLESEDEPVSAPYEEMPEEPVVQGDVIEVEAIAVDPILSVMEETEAASEENDGGAPEYIPETPDMPEESAPAAPEETSEKTRPRRRKAEQDSAEDDVFRPKDEEPQESQGLLF